MSYEIARYFSVDFKKLTATVNCASNNVTPRHYSKFKIEFDKDKYPATQCGHFTDQEVFVLDILKMLVDGSVKLSDSVNKDYRYALMVVLKDMTKNCFNINSAFHDVVRNNDTKLLNELKRYVKLFIEQVEMPDIKQEFIITVDHMGFFYKKTSRGYVCVHSLRDAHVCKSFKEAKLRCEGIKNGNIVALASYKENN